MGIESKRNSNFELSDNHWVIYWVINERFLIFSTSQSKNNLNKPKRGPTIYVQAHNITDELLRTQFIKFGKIINVKLNNPTVGFVTFDKVECAELAVQEVTQIIITTELPL